jgi:hypothetical protein
MEEWGHPVQRARRRRMEIRVEMCQPYLAYLVSQRGRQGVLEEPLDVHRDAITQCADEMPAIRGGSSLAGFRLTFLNLLHDLLQDLHHLARLLSGRLSLYLRGLGSFL